MSDYTRDILKVVVAKICQTIGWHNIQSTSLEIMTDILRRYLSEITKLTHAYSNQFGHTQPNLDELGLALRDMNVNIADLEEFVRYVDTGVALEVPQFPIKKESHLNFLKPGSDEVITRSVHIHEHLPPMLPNNEDAEPSCSFPVVVEESQSAPNMDAGAAIFKRPADISPNELPMKRPRLVIDEPENSYLFNNPENLVTTSMVSEDSKVTGADMHSLETDNTLDVDGQEKFVVKEEPISEQGNFEIKDDPDMPPDHYVKIGKGFKDIEIEIDVFGSTPLIEYKRPGGFNLVERQFYGAGLMNDIKPDSTMINSVSEIIISTNPGAPNPKITYIDMPFNMIPQIRVNQKNVINQLLKVFVIDGNKQAQIPVVAKVKEERVEREEPKVTTKKKRSRRSFPKLRPLYMTRSICKRYNVDITKFF